MNGSVSERLTHDGETLTVTLAEAMVVAREQSKLDKRRARYKCYYDNNPD